MPDYREIFARTDILAGDDTMHLLRHDLRVLVVGVGGVGSWCAEALVRSGLGHIDIVDSDSVDVTNINRQLPATVATVGRPKVEVLAGHFREINPTITVNAVCGRYDESTAESFDPDSYDFVIDAIDDVEAKALLILNTTRCSRPRLLSSMGAARRLDPGKVTVAEFWKVQGCPLARALRTRFKRSGLLPARKFMCVYSPEQPLPQDTGPGIPNGSLMPVTATFGLTLASRVLSEIIIPRNNR